MQSNAKERYTEISVYMQNETKRKRRRRMTFVQLFAIVTIEVDRGKPVHNQTKSKKYALDVTNSQFVAIVQFNAIYILLQQIKKKKQQICHSQAIT